MPDLDTSLTFDNFVVGPANRLAAAAARRAADSPGTSYNPLFLYSASGLGKSHILNAVANHASKRHPEFRVRYQTLEGYLGELTHALEAGERKELSQHYLELDILLLDDVQFLMGQSEAQEMLLQTLDAMSGGGKQVVLASDRPPAEIDGLDARLMSRFSAGMIVDIATPEYETRRAIVSKKVAGRGVALGAPVCETVARFPFKNIRELEGGLNRILAIQDLEEREVGAEEASTILAAGREMGGATGEAGEFLKEISDDVAATVQAHQAPWQTLLLEVARDAESRGYSTDRLRGVIEGPEPEDAEALAEEFRASLSRLEEIGSELERVGNPWPEAALAVLHDPERMNEAEALLLSARERLKPFPALWSGPDLETLSGTYPSLPVKASHRLVAADRPEYTPLFLTCPDTDRARRLLAAAGRSFLEKRPDARVAFISAANFAEDFIRALSMGVGSAWRERWGTLELLLLYDVQALSDTERAQDELFHLFEALKRRHARMFLAADRPPAAIQGIDDRLRSRFEGGLVVEMAVPSPEAEAAELAQEPERPPEATVAEPPEAELGISPAVPAPASRGLDGGLPAGVGADSGALANASVAQLVPELRAAADRPQPEGQQDAWQPSPEKVVWECRRLDDRLIEGSD